MTNWSKLSKHDRRELHRRLIIADDINHDNVKAIGFNALGGGTFNKGVYIFRSYEDADEFLFAAPATRDVIYL